MAKQRKKSPNMVDISSHSDKRKRKKKSKGARRVKKVLLTCGKVIASLILILAITGSIVITALTVYVMKFVEPDESIDIKDAGLGYTTTLIATDAQGNETEIATLHSRSIREWADLDQIPQHVRMAFVCAEDKRFYDHDGVDWKRTFAAFFNLFLHFYSTKQGGSTITQQLIKNITGDDDVNIGRKFTEIFRAVNLEKVYSKDQILESYLNLIPLDQSIYGVQAAAKYYFNKDISQLDVVEGAALAAMVKAPRTYNPILHPQANKDRRNAYVLQAMYEEGVITAEEFETYKNTDLVTAIDPTLPESDTDTGYNSWFTDAVIEEVVADLVSKNGWSKEYAENQVLNGGLKIYTTQDPNIQRILEEKYLQDSTFASSAKVEIPQSAMVIMDYSGSIKGIVGARGPKEGNRIWNNATMATRSPGSSIKPLSAYSSAVESNLITYSSMMTDEPVPTYLGGVLRENWPSNYDHVYRGDILIPEAIQRSTNTIPVQLVNQLSPQFCFNFLVQRLHLTTLSENDATTPRLALGGLWEGIHLDELTAAYQIFGNQGQYTEQHTYTRVLNAAGDVILEKNPIVSRALTPESATIMNRILQNVVEGPNGTGRNARLSGWTVVGKTGTATNDKGGTTDQLFVGCTPYYVAGVWFGYTDNRTLPSGFNSITTIWRTVMSEVMAGLPKKSFEYSNDVVERSYCTESGLLAVETCPSQATGYYKRDYLPDYCPIH